jgi:hypothetical protein
MDRPQPTDDTHSDPTTPSVGPGITALRCPHPRTGALHRVAMRTIRGVNGPVYWVDARNTASTYALSRMAPSDRALDQIRVARAFTAYQHFTLVERVINRVTPQTGCIVAPNLPSLYCDDDVPDHEANEMVEAAYKALATLADSLDLPVLVSTVTDRFDELIDTHAARTIECIETELGYRFEGETVRTHGYWYGEWWQTTIPYWVDLFGTGSASLATGEIREPARALEG